MHTSFDKFPRYPADETGIELLKRTPSAFLGSCRFKMPKIEGHEEVYEKVFELRNVWFLPNVLLFP